MAGIAVATIVWSMAAMNMPTISPDRDSMIWRWVRLAEWPSDMGRPSE
jgi:hypothetical protein